MENIDYLVIITKVTGKLVFLYNILQFGLSCA